MALPTYEEFMFPILKCLSDNEIHYKHDIFNEMKEVFKLTEEQINETLPSQTQPTYMNRIGWALTYLKKAGLLESPSRAYFKITDEGQNIVKDNIINLNSKFLNKYKSFQEFQNLTHDKDTNKQKNQNIEQTPFEQIMNSYNVLKQNICDELLEKVIEISPYSFEQIVVDLIVSMGYGGNIEEAGQATKKSGDGGIDGLIKEDTLGLSKIYLQAKRYGKDNYVGYPEISKFFGALHLCGASKGIFITTSDFSQPALEALKKNTSISVIPINGKKLVELMFDYNIGLSNEKSISIKRIDSDYFESL